MICRVAGRPDAAAASRADPIRPVGPAAPGEWRGAATSRWPFEREQAGRSPVPRALRRSSQSVPRTSKQSTVTSHAPARAPLALTPQPRCQHRPLHPCPALRVFSPLTPRGSRLVAGPPPEERLSPAPCRRDGSRVEPGARAGLSTAGNRPETRGSRPGLRVFGPARRAGV
jgi:hypothetical protein